MMPMKNSTSSRIRIRMMTSSRQVAARHLGLIDGEAVDVVERIQLLLDVLLPALETETPGDERA